MGFNTNKYLGETRRPQTGAVEVPGLEAYFDKGDELYWLTRGLGGIEYMELKNSIGEPDTMIAAFRAIGMDDKVEAVEESLGILKRLSKTDRLNMALFVAGSVDENVTMEVARRICNEHFGIYRKIVNSIDILTGTGFVPGKPLNSGDVET